MPDLYLNKIPIVRRSLNEGFLRGVPGHLLTGAVPRDFAIDPVVMGDPPAGMAVAPESEWDARHDEQIKNKDGLLHLYLGPNLDAPAFQFLDQNGFPDCWAHSTGHALMFDYLKQGLPVPRLNAVAVATLMGQTNGGWCGLSMGFARDKGYPVVGDGPGEWPYQSRRGQDTAELRATMARHKAVSGWWDLGRQAYDQTLTRSQLATCGFMNWPAPSDYNRFGHSMLMIGWARIEAGHWGPLTLNSWQGFGYHGLCVLADMWPDNSVALRSSTPSAR